MNRDRLGGNWKEVKGQVTEQWVSLTDDRLDKVAGKREELVSKIRECYGIRKNEAEFPVKDGEGRNHDVFARTAAEVQKYVGTARQKLSAMMVVLCPFVFVGTNYLFVRLN